MNHAQRIARNALLPLFFAALSSPVLQAGGIAHDLAPSKFASSQAVANALARPDTRAAADKLALIAHVGNSLTGDITRIGNALEAIVLQSGYAHEASIEQHGLHNQGLIVQYGANNQAHIEHVRRAQLRADRTDRHRA